MKRLTTDRPEDNVQNTLNLFYIRNRETWIRGGGPAPQYKDVSLDDFMRRMIKEKHVDEKVPERWSEFSEMMAEWLMDEPESETGMLALVYAAAWGFAEIRERLKRYEDTGAMPDVLEELLEGLTRIEKLGGWDLVDRWVKAASEGRLVELPKEGEFVMVDKAKATAPIKQKAYSTMCNMRKQDLIDYIRELEHNYNVAIAFNEQQAQNFEMLLKEQEERRLQLPKEDADGILIGGTYRHFKGKEYVAMGVAQYTETGEPMVIYGDENGKIWARQKRDFLSIVNRNGQKYRFELVEGECNE